ncbi:unnamed protein product [Didymodactylos carnosus]|uniref:Uncharacterized protein n=1 Tax=Didymodactylos carnosus TaxID=1234261 RepID=A0A814FNZ5_9BILA|nr:unnamed protein product [Didymodactylos carnosus]CAF3756959.1 unnamed protein product [Didymodactylos carnosus]
MITEHISRGLVLQSSTLSINNRRAKPLLGAWHCCLLSLIIPGVELNIELAKFELLSEFLALRRPIVQTRTRAIMILSAKEMFDALGGIKSNA